MPKLKYTGSFLVSVATLAPVLIYFIFLAQQELNFRLMFERLERENLQCLSLSTDDFTWKKKGKEIRIKGRMFDVEKFVEENGQVVVWGLFDDTETDLMQKIDRLLAATNGSAGKGAWLDQLIRLMNETGPLLSDFKALPDYQLTQLYSGHNCPGLPHYDLLKESPPPKSPGFFI